MKSKYPDRIVTVSYESFVSDQRAVITKICDFLGLEFTEDMLDIGSSDEAQELAKISPLWRANHSDPVRTALTTTRKQFEITVLVDLQIASNVDKYKKKLSYRDICVIETLCERFMLRYGYSFITSHDAVVTDADLEAARRESAERKAAAWEKLKVEFDLNPPRSYIHCQLNCPSPPHRMTKNSLTTTNAGLRERSISRSARGGCSSCNLRS